jgi:hypothetical protein
MARKIELTNQFNYYKKKRNLFLFFIIIWIIFIATTFLLVNNVFQFTDFSLFVLMIQLILFMFWFYYYINVFQNYVTYHKYYKMLLEDVKEKKGSISEFPDEIIKQLIDEKFVKGIDRDKYSIYFLEADNSRKFIKQGFIIVIIIKDNFVDYYDDEIENDINFYKQKINKINFIQKEFILQLRTFKSLNGSTKDDLNKIINYNFNRKTLIHLNVGYVEKLKTYYVLRPLKLYPNRHYYECVKWIDQIYGGF